MTSLADFASCEDARSGSETWLETGAMFSFAALDGAAGSVVDAMASQCLRNKRLPGWYLNAPVAPSTTCSPSTPHQPGHVAPTERRLTRMSEQDAQPTSVTEPPRSTQSHPSQLKSHSQDLSIVPPQRPIPPSKRTSNRAATSGSNEPRTRTPTQPSQHRPTVEEIERSLEVIAPLADADEGMREQVRELRVLLDRVRRRTAALIDRGRRLHQLRLALEREVSTDLQIGRAHV